MPVDDEAPQGGATLTGGPHRREQDGTHREFQIGGGRHDHAVVAAKLEDATPEPFRDHGCHRATHPRTARGADDGYPRIADHGIADFGPAHDHLQEPRWRIPERPGGTIEQRLAGQGTQRGLFGGLPHDAVPAHQRQGRVPRPHRHRKIERRNDTDDAHRMPVFRHPVAGAFRRHRQSIELPGQADGKVADIDHLLDFADSLGANLAGLQGHQRTESVLVSA